MNPSSALSHALSRRHVLAGTVAAAAAARSAAAHPSAGREWYELRRYRVAGAEKQAVVLAHLRDALVPALGRVGVGPVGVFVPAEGEEGHDVHALLTFPELARLDGLDEALAADVDFVEAAREYYAATDEDAAYVRIESRLLHAFSGMPRVEVPTKGAAPGLYELRTYESRTADAARRKVEMFDRGEIELMREVGLGPVFYGATRIGHDVPNLTYMLSATDAEAHAAHWKAFLAHPDWDRMKVLPRYATTVSKIVKTMLRPAPFSAI